ncbi:hypothetical protein CALCODRAFT_554640 [Calocera cornea HHB12733]|uniref:Uncharacterized protein n=1 Tax=Calocera cornea HHB12733 TaxID=1353952 RepID=A0A165GZC9_9BASI|nr:hypothetical protein CALCODRAFT_554640 [Calocera cornea HHB12733]
MSSIIALTVGAPYNPFRPFSDVKVLVSPVGQLGLGLAKTLPKRSPLSWLLSLTTFAPAHGITGCIASHTGLLDPMAGYGILGAAPLLAGLDDLRLAYEKEVAHDSPDRLDIITPIDLQSEPNLASPLNSADEAIDPPLSVLQDEAPVQDANAALGNALEWGFSALPLATPGPTTMELTDLDRQVHTSEAGAHIPLVQEDAGLNITNISVGSEDNTRNTLLADAFMDRPSLEDSCDVDIIDTEMTDSGEIIVSTSLPRLTISLVDNTPIEGPPDLTFSWSSPPSSPDSYIDTPSFVTITLTDWDDEEHETEVLATSSILTSPLCTPMERSSRYMHHESSHEERLHTNVQDSFYGSEDEDSVVEEMERQLCDGETLADSLPGHSHPDAPSKEEPPASLFYVTETGSILQWMYTDPDVPAFEWWIRTERDGTENPEFTYGVGDGWVVAYPEEDYDSVRSEYLSLRGNVIRADPLPALHLYEEEEDEEEAHY